jgi:hypothetical protein
MTKWNIMIYLAGDNNLSEEMVWALKEMQTANTDPNIVNVQFDPLGDQIPVQRYRVKRGSNSLYEDVHPLPSRLDADEHVEFKKWYEKGRKHGKIKTRHRFEPENTGNPTALVEFVWWATKRTPSKNRKHMLIVSGHGCGFESDFLLRDDSTRDSLTINELAQALQDAKKRLGVSKIDILGMDSCLMSTAEVCYQVRDSVNFMVSSEGFESNAGWPYRKILQNLSDDPEKTAVKIVKDYIHFCFDYTIGGQSADLSACNVAHSRLLRNVVTGLKDALMKPLEHPLFLDAIILAHWRAQSYNSDQSVDLVDFAKALIVEVAKIDAGVALKFVSPNGKETAKVKSDLVMLKADICKACENVVRAMVGDETNGRKSDSEKTIVLKSGYTGPAFQHSHGLSIHFPWARLSEEYAHLDFAKATGWHKFLSRYVDVTRGKRRSGYSAKNNDFLKGVMDPPLGTEIRTDEFTPIPPPIRATPDANRGNTVATPGSRATPDANRGKLASKSMKNPALDWRACDLLRESGSPALRLLKHQKEA